MRRPKGTGSVIDLGHNRWRLRVAAGKDPLTGKRREVERTITAKGKTAASKALDALRAEVLAEPVSGPGVTVRQLIEEWTRHAEARGRAPATIYTAQRSLRLVIGPAFGDVAVGDLTTRMVDDLYRRLAVGEGRARPLSATTIRRHHAVLSNALNQAVRWQWIPSNPASRATLPRLDTAEMRIPTDAEVAALLRRADEAGERWGVLVRLALLTGARRGELAGLRWSDVDDDPTSGGLKARLWIRRSVYRIDGRTGVKSTKGGRDRYLALAPGLSLVLEDWRQRCEAKAADAGVTLDPDGYVVSPRPDGSKPVNVGTISATMAKICKDAGIPHVHLHTLRHLAATEMLAAGVSPNDAAALLGHADGGRLALAVYGHATDDRQRRAAEVLDRFT